MTKKVNPVVAWALVAILGLLAAFMTLREKEAISRQQQHLDSR